MPKTNQKEFANKIYRKYKTRLRRFIAQRIESEQDIEEILQETLISATQSFSLFSSKSSLFTWLCGIAKHEIADFYRKKKIKNLLFSHFPWLENLASQALGPEQILLRKEFEERIRETMAELSEGYREILRLKYYEGLTVVQIAKKLNETVKAVESRLFRARKAFAKTFLADFSQRGLSFSG
jgi:RNA polymerase sigma-70 factor (ECF subfamily)